MTKLKFRYRNLYIFGFDLFHKEVKASNIETKMRTALANVSQNNSEDLKKMLN